MTIVLLPLWLNLIFYPTQTEVEGDNNLLYKQHFSYMFLNRYIPEVVLRVQLEILMH